MSLRDIDGLALARDTVSSALNRIQAIAMAIHPIKEGVVVEETTGNGTTLPSTEAKETADRLGAFFRREPSEDAREGALAIARVAIAGRATCTAVVHLDAPEERTTLGDAVYRLTRYAQRGEPLDASVQEYCVTLIGAADDALDDSGAPDPETPLGLVVSAALCREDLERGEAVSTARLAALASVTIGRVQQLVASGDLPAQKRDGDNYVRADDARRWLSGRGLTVERRSDG